MKNVRYSFFIQPLIDAGYFCITLYITLYITLIYYRRNRQLNGGLSKIVDRGQSFSSARTALKVTWRSQQLGYRARAPCDTNCA